MGYLSPPPAPAPVVVYKDVGGLVSDYEAQTEVYRQENREVRLHECRSACTIALGLPNVCVYPDAKIKFHQAYNAITREIDHGVSARLFGYYPEAVQSRLDHLTREYRVLSGTELIALGMRNCNGDDRILIASKKTQEAPTPPASPLRDIARTVETAVASALERKDNSGPAPIRIAVADRSPVPGSSTRTINDATSPVLPPTRPNDADSAGVVAAQGGNAAIDPPAPPRRPPSLAMTAQDAEPAPARLQLIKGAQPIVTHTQFMPRAPAGPDPAGFSRSASR